MLSGLVVGIGVLIWFGVWMLTTGKLKVQTAENAKVSILAVEEGEVSKRELGAGPSVSERLDPGEYTVAATTPEGETRATAAVQARQTTRIKLKIEQPKQPEKLLFGNAYAIAANNNRLRFLDKNMQQLHESQPPHQKASGILFKLFPVTDIKWSDYNSAFVKLRNNSYKVLVNGKIRPFKYPSGLQPEADFIPVVSSYDVNQNGQLVIGIEGNIYVYPSLAGSPRKVAETERENITVRISETGRVFAFDSPTTGEATNQQPFNKIYTPKGKEIPATIHDRSVSSAHWNPDGKKLIATIKDGVYVYNLGERTLKQFIKFPPDNIESVAWKNKNTFFMIDDGSIWRVDVMKKKWHKVAETPNPIRHRNAMTLSANGQTLYFGTTSRGLEDSGSLYTLDVTQ